MSLLPPNEKKAYGLLGKPPENWLNCSKSLIREWVTLLRRAESVARVRGYNERLRLAKQVQSDREDLVARMEAELAKH